MRLHHPLRRGIMVQRIPVNFYLTKNTSNSMAPQTADPHPVHYENLSNFFLGTTKQRISHTPDLQKAIFTQAHMFHKRTFFATVNRKEL